MHAITVLLVSLAEIISKSDVEMSHVSWGTHGLVFFRVSRVRKAIKKVLEAF